MTENYFEWHNIYLLVDTLHEPFLVGKLTFKLTATQKLNETKRKKLWQNWN